jgi:hypothetical protein
MAQEGFEPSASLVLSESGLPVAYRANAKFRGLESNQRPPRSERGVTTSSNYPGVVGRIREEGFEPPPPDSKSGSLPVSRFPRASCGSRTRLSDLGSPCLAARPRTLCTSFDSRCNVPDSKTADQSGIGDSNPGRLVGSQESCHWTNPALREVRERKERELNPQGSSLARVRVGCRRRSACPSISGSHLDQS